MGRAFAVLVVVLGLILAVWLMGIIGPFVAAIGLLGALVVLLDPAGVGTRIRRSPGWWGVPGMRPASRGAVPFAAMLLLYSVPIPLGAFALVRAGAGTHPSAPGPIAQVGGGTEAPTGTATPSPTVPATRTLTLAPVPPSAATSTPPPAATRAATPPPTPPPTPQPTAPPKTLCGAPTNPWGYNFCGGGTITSPAAAFCDYFTCIASFWDSTKGYVEQCGDGTYSHSGGRRGSCSSHGGDRRALNPR